jgi:hypothetical protein
MARCGCDYCVLVLFEVKQFIWRKVDQIRADCALEHVRSIIGDKRWEARLRFARLVQTFQLAVDAVGFGGAVEFIQQFGVLLEDGFVGGG